MSPLPLLSEVSFDENGLSAWRDLLDAEQDAMRQPTAKTAKYQDNLVGIRVLGFFMKDFWDHRSQHDFVSMSYSHLVKKIHSCAHKATGCIIGSAEDQAAQHSRLYELGILYRNHLMRVFRSHGDPSPTSSDHSSRSSFEYASAAIVQEMIAAPQTKQDAKKQALVRDGYKCMLTGQYDFKAAARYPDILRNEDDFAVTTQCAHLFSGSAQDSNAATAFAMLKMFELEDVINELLGGQINSLCNVMTMAAGLHIHFDDCIFWLEEVTGQPNTYDIRRKPNVPRDSTLALLPKRVTFRVDPAVMAECERKGVRIPDLPDRGLIAIRSACARVAHMSGAAEQIDRILRDEEETVVLARDGSSAELLSSLILRRAGVNA